MTQGERGKQGDHGQKGDDGRRGYPGRDAVAIFTWPKLMVLLTCVFVILLAIAVATARNVAHTSTVCKRVNANTVAINHATGAKTRPLDC